MSAAIGGAERAVLLVSIHDVPAHAHGLLIQRLQRVLAEQLPDPAQARLVYLEGDPLAGVFDVLASKCGAPLAAMTAAGSARVALEFPSFDALPERMELVIVIWDLVTNSPPLLHDRLAALKVPYRLVSPFRHDAFISYQRADERAAARVQRWLESRRLPPVLRRGGARRVLVFRDDTDLSTASDLTHELMAKLETSAALLVLVSPSSSRSRWVKLEIAYFLRARPRAPVIPVLVGGAEPDELLGELFGGDASHVPLAADLREQLPLESSVRAWRRARSALVKVYASLLGLNVGAMQRADVVGLVARATSAVLIALILATSLAAAAHYRANQPKDFGVAVTAVGEVHLENRDATPQQPHGPYPATELPGYVVALPGDARAVATAHRNRVVVWDASGAKAAEYVANRSIVRGLAFERRGRYVAAGSDDGTVSLFDVQRRIVSSVHRHHDDQKVLGLAFCGDEGAADVVSLGCSLLRREGDGEPGELPVSASGNVARWDFRAGAASVTPLPPDLGLPARSAIQKACAGGDAPDVAISCTQAGNALIVMGGETFEAPREGPIRRVGPRVETRPARAVLAADGRALVEARKLHDGGYAIEVRDPSSPPSRFELPEVDRILGLAAGASARDIAVAVSGSSVCNGPCILHYRRGDPGAGTHVLCRAIPAPGLLSVAIAADSPVIAAGGTQVTFRALDVDACVEQVDDDPPELFASPKATLDLLYALSTSRTGLIAVGGVGLRITVFDLVNARLLRSIPHAHKGRIRAAALSADGHRLASVGELDRTLRVWDLRGDAPPRSFDGPIELETREPKTRSHRPVGYVSAALSADGESAAASDDLGCLHLCSISAGACARVAGTGADAGAPCHDVMKRADPHQGWILGMTFVDGATLATAGFDGRLRLWRVAVRPSGPTITIDRESVVVANNIRQRTDEARQTMEFTAVASGADVGLPGVIVAAARGGDLFLWKANGDLERFGDHGGAIGVLAVVRLDERPHVVSGGEDGRLAVWGPVDREGSQRRMRYALSGSNWIMSAAWLGCDGAISWLSSGAVNIGRLHQSRPVLRLFPFTNGDWAFVSDEYHMSRITDDGAPPLVVPAGLAPDPDGRALARRYQTFCAAPARR